tara:strand:- start:240 stop:389 length:150 start_codon:yes stop_codon:yes gene_type:complete
MKIQINLKNMNKKKAYKIFDKLYKDLKEFRGSREEAFLILNKKGWCLTI